jgi:hypothetical protein
MASPTDLDLLLQLTASLPDSSPFVTVPDGWGLRMMRARSDARAGTRLAKVAMISDSIGSAGQGASDPRNNSMAGLIQNDLRDKWGNGGSGYLSHEYAAKTGTWVTGVELTFGGGGATATSAATMRWDNMEGTTLRIFHRNANLTGTFRWRIDGGAWTTVAPPTGFGVEPGIVEVVGQTDVLHTIEVEWLSGTIGIHGVQGFRATGVILDRIGQSGRAASHYAPMLLERIPGVTTTSASASVTTAAPGSFRPYMTGKYLGAAGVPLDTTITVTSATAATLSKNATASATVAADLFFNPPSWANCPGITTDPFFAVGLGRPDLVIFMLAANDPANADYNERTWMEGASRWVAQYTSGTAYDYSPDFIFVIEHFGNWFDIYSRKAAVAAAVAQLAAAVGGVVIDVFGEARRSYKYWNDRGMFSDSIHPSTAGHREYAKHVLSLIP